MKKILLALLLIASPAAAQWQTPTHSVPVGKGSGIIGFGSAAPGAAGIPLTSNGASSDPSFGPVGTAGIASNAVTNALLAAAPANTAKCNPTGGTAAVQDCTGSQIASFLPGTTTPINTFTGNKTLLTSDCNTVVRLGTGASGQATFTVPAGSPSSNGFTSLCRVKVYNGDTYTAGTASGKILSGVPAPQFYILFAQQSFDLELDVNANAWIVTRQAGRWLQTGPQFYATAGTTNGDTANDCLSIGTACATINHAVNSILYARVDNLNGAPIVFLSGTFSECAVFAGQLTGVNVGFIEGTSPGSTIWNTNGACAALLIGDNAEWETSNITLESTTANGSGIFIHQPAVVDLLSGTNFGAFSGTGAAVGSDHGGFINFDQAGGNVLIGPGSIGTFLALGPGTQMVGSFTAAFQSTPTIGTWMTITGAGAMANYAAFAISGTYSAGTSTCRGPSAFTLGSSLPGGAPTASLGCQSM